MGTRLNLLYNSGNLKVPLDLNNPYAKPWRVLVSRIAWILRSVLRHANHYHAFLSSDHKYFLSCYWCGQSVKRSTHTLTFQGTRFVKCARVFYAVIRKGEGFKSSLWTCLDLGKLLIIYSLEVICICIYLYTVYRNWGWELGSRQSTILF